MHVVFVCTGNICRSPMAEALLKARAVSSGMEGVQVSSMGTHALDGHPAAAQTVTACGELGIDVTGHRARSLVLEELRCADHIFTMDLVQKDYVVDMCPGVEGRVALAGSWPGVDSLPDCVPDPIGRSLSVYRNVLTMLSRHVERIGCALF